MREKVYHDDDWESDEDVEEVVKPKYIVHDPNIRWNKMEPNLGDIIEFPGQLKILLQIILWTIGIKYIFPSVILNELLQDVEK